MLVSSYCGVIIVKFTGGASGAVWLGPLFIFLVSITVLWRHQIPELGGKSLTIFTNLLFVMFILGIFIGLMRFDVSLEAAKSGSFKTFAGIPIRYLMMVYRLHIVSFLFLAIALPLRYEMDRELFLKCLKLCWLFTLVLSILTILDYLGVANFSYDYRRTFGYKHVAILGFHRGSHGMMIVIGIFMSFAMTQLTRSYFWKVIAYCSAPILILGLLFTWSRSALLALAVASTSLIITLGGTKAIKGLLVILLGLLVVSIIMSKYPDLQERFSFFTSREIPIEVESAGRLAGWAKLLTWLFQNPDVLILGVGFQNFNYYINVQSQVVELEAGHNNYLHILAELGFVGLIVFVGWLISIFFWLVSWRRAVSSRVDKTMCGIFISLMLGIAASCITQESLAPSPAMIPLLTHFFILLGIWRSYYRRQMLEISENYESLSLNYP